MAKHSTIGASGAYRWMACPGSVRMSQGLESPTSEYAAEGTVAHWVGESALREDLPASAFIGETREEDGFVIEVTEEMCQAVQVYLDFVRGILEKYPDAVLHIERSFHLKRIHPDAFGTADTVIWIPSIHKLIVADYKHGQGIPVEVEDNPQGLYYALGALLETDYPAEEIDITIVQPRCPHEDGPVRAWTLDVLDLLEWTAELKKAIEATQDPDAPLHAGDHCRFCPAAAVCPELKRQAIDAAKTEFKPEWSFDPEALAETLKLVPTIEAWCKSVREFAYQQAEQGAEIPGWKLVAKRAQRKWRDPDEARAALETYGLLTEDIFNEPKMKTPPQIEKTAGKAIWDSLGDLVIQESSGHTLAPDDDNRPAVRSSAADDFDPLT